ncbi:vacuolar protein sorting-associated protein VPS13 [Histomonas meleagridis]|uniref:vacuolar protein sorting-associated protein VPS13 n=1 Tax=Histomonas meleagridis TaxID=135588 RepID=UPI0035593CB4|nr:vacuolar protein sorting-associated protein VPS13 [Histomonas meleagridis]KAH0802893.1 vacuolar protein sorting-associated protein VPS13 [Histomonas meleagridis]
MINSIAAKLISHLCGEYIEAIDSSNLETQIWNGKARLEKLIISENALINKKLPFRIKSGTIGSISLSFPWGKLSSEPCVVDIENIFVILDVCGAVLVSRDLQVVAPKIETENDKAKNNNNVSSGSIWSGLLQKVVDNLIVNVKNIHVRIEAKSNEEKCVAFGVTIPSINAFTVDENFQKVFVTEHKLTLKKKLTIQDFAIYIDTDVTEIGKDNFDEKMLSGISSTHQHILKPFTFDGILTHSDDVTIDFANDFNIITTTLNLSLDILQFRGLSVLKDQYSKFCKQRLYSQCGKPDRLPRSVRSSGLWWRYIHRTTLVKNKTKIFNFSNALEFFKNRRKYYELYTNYIQKVDGSKIQLDSFEESLDQSTVVQLRSYVIALKYQQTQDVKEQLTQEEIDEIYNIQEQNLNRKNNFKVNLNIKSLGFSLLNEFQQKITEFNINDVIAKMTKIEFNTETSYEISSINISNEMSTIYPKTIYNEGLYGTL